MKSIKKGTEPISLTHHRAKPHATYENYPAKEDLREALLAEQGDICCYCMQRITKENMKIEHWKPQKHFPQLQLNYKNLLGACIGNEGKPEHLQHCDTHKRQAPITINPTDKSCETFIKFSKSGEISSDNETVNRDLHKTLNLNMQSLVNNRKSVLDIVLTDFYQKHPQRTWTKAILEREVQKWSPIKGPYKEYCQIVVFHLKKKLAKVSQ